MQTDFGGHSRSYQVKNLLWDTLFCGSERCYCSAGGRGKGGGPRVGRNTTSCSRLSVKQTGASRHGACKPQSHQEEQDKRHLQLLFLQQLQLLLELFFRHGQVDKIINAHLVTNRDS